VSSQPLDVLVVEDDPAIHRFLRNTLAVQGYRVHEVSTGREALKAVREARPHLIVLDLGLADMDGMDLIAHIRALSPVPILVLSSRSDEPGKVMALDLGADDYITKPFGVDEFMARVRTALRHRLVAQGSPPIVRTGALVVDLVHRTVTRGGDEIRLSPKEYDILRELVMHAGKVLTHRHLLRVAWGNDEVDVQYLRVYVRQLRQKIETSPDQPRYIVTEPGVGYRLQILD
jgi:two-component system KDP operon response regulator KdpE